MIQLIVFMAGCSMSFQLGLDFESGLLQAVFNDHLADNPLLALVMGLSC